jgi:hypothetical protein
VIGHGYRYYLKKLYASMEVEKSIYIKKKKGTGVLTGPCLNE